MKRLFYLFAILAIIMVILGLFGVGDLIPYDMKIPGGYW